jgi:hypothetical protein
VTTEHLDDLLLRAVSQVARIEEDHARAERTRARCRQKLQSRMQAARRREFTALLGNLLRWRGVL